MKTIYFVRHAKSSWEDARLADHDRPLNQRGKRDAPLMGEHLRDLGIQPDGLLSSTARRARETADAFRRAMEIPAANCLFDKALYHAWPRGIEARIRELPAAWDTVLLFGHNPGYTELANQLVHHSFIDNVPTCGVVGATTTIDHWSDFTLADSRRTVYLYPKQLV